MKCLECQEVLQKRLDGERVPANDALERHLSECPACRDLHAGAARLLEGLKQIPQPKLAPDFARSLTSQVVQDRRERRAKMGRRVFVTIALAASVVLILLLTYHWVPRQQHDEKHPSPNLAKEHKAPPTPMVTPKQVPEPKPAPRNALTSLTDRIADTTRDHAQVVLVGTNLDAMEKLPPVNELPMIDPSVREAGQEVSDGVRTVTRTTRRAFDFFTRELPMPDMGEQKH
jgi:hypothetical protein